MDQHSQLTDFDPPVRAAIRSAADLNTGAVSSEYLRGQVELMCAVFGLDSDENREPLTEAILTLAGDYDPMTAPVMVMSGNPRDGFAVYGPLVPNTPQIEDLTDNHLRNVDWWYVPISTLP